MTESPTILTTWSTAVLAAVVFSAPGARTARADEKPMEAPSPVDVTVREAGADGRDTRRSYAVREACQRASVIGNGEPR